MIFWMLVTVCWITPLFLSRSRGHLSITVRADHLAPLIVRRYCKLHPRNGKTFTETARRSHGNMDVTEHAHLVETFLYDKLCFMFPRPPRSRRNSVFSDHTWDIYRMKGQAKKTLSRCRKLHDMWLLSWSVAHWRDKDPRKARVSVFISTLRACGRWKQHKTCALELKQGLDQDRANFAEALLAPLQSAPGKSAVRLP